MRDYMETFSKMFLKGKANFQLQAEVLKVRREKTPSGGSPATWIVTVKDLKTGNEQDLTFNRVIVATGVRTYICAAAGNDDD